MLDEHRLQRLPAREHFTRQDLDQPDRDEPPPRPQDVARERNPGLVTAAEQRVQRRIRSSLPRRPVEIDPQRIDRREKLRPAPPAEPRL